MVELFGYVLAFVIGIIMGLIGAGGSILSSGLMIYVFGFNPIISSSYTLLNVGVISLIGSIQYYRKDLIDLPTGLIFSLPAIATVLLMRTFIMPAIPNILLQYDGLVISKELCVMLVFALLMIFIAWNMIGNKAITHKPKDPITNRQPILFVGIVVGILTGIVGVGGGFVIVPALFFFTALDMKSAVGTSLFIITLNTTVGFIGDFSSGVIYNWPFLFRFISITVAGMLVSELMVHKIKTEKLKRLFAVVMLLLGCWIIFKELMLEKKLVEKTRSESPCHEMESLRVSPVVDG